MIKTYPDDLFEEIRLLAKFPEESHMEGLKIHNEADPIMISAAKALFKKGLTTLDDGGYLTDSGREMAEHLHTVLDTMNQK